MEVAFTDGWLKAIAVVLGAVCASALWLAPAWFSTAVVASFVSYGLAIRVRTVQAARRETRTN
jgi:hypothetical protein